MFPVFGHFNAPRLSSNDADAIGLESICKVQRSLTTELHDCGPTFFMLVDIKNIFESQWLKVKFIARVVVGRNGFGVRVNHDGFKPFFSQRERGMNAAVIKLDTLTNSIRATPEDHDFLAGASSGFVFLAISRIIIGSVGFELGGTCVNQAIGRNDSLPNPLRPHVGFGGIREIRNLSIGESELFYSPEAESPLSNSLFLINDLADIFQKPGIDSRKLANSFDRNPGQQGVAQIKDPIPGCIHQLATDFFDVPDTTGCARFAVPGIGPQSEAPDFQ